MAKIENCTVVIRSVGERTEQTCFKLLEDLFPAGHIQVISDTPFSATLRKSLQHGITQNREWTLCIDADVLIEQKALRTLFERSAMFDDTYFEFHGFVADKFFYDIRPAGNHLYRTQHLQKSIELIPQEGTTLRPETYMLTAMNKIGFKNKYFSDMVVGIHDFEQYYSDIFRKGYLHSRKHVFHLSKLLPVWSQKAKTDDDFRVFLFGVGCGIASDTDVTADKSKTPFNLFEILSKGIKEKSLLKKEQIAFDDITKTILRLMSSIENKPTGKFSFVKQFIKRIYKRI